MTNEKEKEKERLDERLRVFDDLLQSTETLPLSTWTDFLAVWFDLLDENLEEIASSSQESLRLLGLLLKRIDVNRIRADATLCEHTCFQSLRKLDRPSMRSYLQLSREDQHLIGNELKYKHVFSLLHLAGQTISYLPFHSSHQRDFLADHLPLIELFIDRVHQRMPQPSTPGKDISLGTIAERILVFLWNLTDRLLIVPLLLRTALIERVLDWLSRSSLLTRRSRRPLISLIQNLARHDQSVPIFTQFNAIDIIKHYQSKSLETSPSRQLLISMSLASLSTAEELKGNGKGMNDVLDQLLQLIMDSFRGVRYRFEGIHLSEPLQILVKLFVVEERTLDYLLFHAETDPPRTLLSTIELFLLIFNTFIGTLALNDQLDQFTLLAIINLLWSLSFLPVCQPPLRADLSFIERINTLSESHDEDHLLRDYQPKSMENLHQAAKGIRHNLFPSSNPTAIDTSTSTNWMMISYSHDNALFCDEVHRCVRESLPHVNVWLDRTHLEGTGDLWESIAHAMERSQLICVLLSPQYFSSKSCRQEFIYASDSLKKTILPILINDFQPKGWLGIRVTALKYVRFRNEHSLEEKKKNELLTAIRSSFSPSTTPTTHNDQCSPPVDRRRRRTNGDVDAWFDSAHLSQSFADLFAFESEEEMINYAHHLFKDVDKQMNIYSKIYSDKYPGKEMPPHEFLRFTEHLRQLTKERSSSPVSKASPSRTCLLM